MKETRRAFRPSRTRDPKIWALAILIVCVGAWAAVAQQSEVSDRYPDSQVLLDPPPEEWLNYGRDHAGTHYSPVDQIDAENVDRLGLAWYYDTGSFPGSWRGPL
jgi:glucose dehydrogenase